MSEQNFAVDLGGIVELLSSHLYSGPQVYVRELLQNAVDATVARGEPNPAAIRMTSIVVDGRPGLKVVDEGSGLTPQEARDFMSVVGRSSKRDELGLAREDLLGQFGVGILSCFAVSDRIEVRTQSHTGGPGARWVGNANGTWDVQELPESSTIGTEVTIVARHGEDRLFSPEYVLSHLRSYGELIRQPVMYQADPDSAPTLITRTDVPSRNPAASEIELREFATEMLGFEPMAVLRIGSPSGQVAGLACVLPHSLTPGASRADRVYVKGMLVDPQCDKVLPEWAFFVQCILEADGLHPTASREQIHDDHALAMAREELGSSLRGRLMDLAATSPELLGSIVTQHDVSMKALAVTDRDFLLMVGDWLPIETAEGRMSLGQFRRTHPVALVTKTVDEFRQIAPIALSQGVGLVSGGYIHSSELLHAADAAWDDFAVHPARLEELFTGFGEVPTADSALAADLGNIATRRLDEFKIDVEVRVFEPAEMPALVVESANAAAIRSLEKASTEVGGMFSEILAGLAESEELERPILALNLKNPAVRRLAEMGDTPLTRTGIEVLYLQALLAGQHMMRPEESALLNTSLLTLLDKASGSSPETR